MESRVMSLIHASCIAFGKVGVLIRGGPGSGKSSLCFRLIDQEGFGLGDTAMRAELVADDQVEIRLTDGALIASAPAALAGKLEIRGLGIVDLHHRSEAALKLVVDLGPAKDIPRMPEAVDGVVTFLGVNLPRLMLDATTVDAPARLRAALGHFGVFRLS
jgi:serine kinase of HPr protein (carbohydrate metabolism regulator)